MKIRILQDGRYSDFDVPGRPHKVGAKQRAAGDVVDYPDWYAESLVASGLAKMYTESQPVTRLLATAAATRLASERDVNLSAVTGSGAGGRITAGDVRKAAQ